MKILITGGAGFIGSNLSSFLLKRGAKLTVLDDFSRGKIENIKNLEIELIKGGIEDEKLLKSLRGKRFDFIHHQAAITDTTIENEEEMIKVNVEGFKNILNLAKKEKANVIYASSAGVYGNGPLPMKEDQELIPLNVYGLSKAKADALALDFIKENLELKVVGLRYFNVYGKNEAHKGKSASMIWQLFCQMKEGKSPRIFKYGEQERDFVYIKDVVLATEKAMEAKRSGIVNVGTGKRTSFNRIVEILNEVLGTKFEPEYIDNPYSFYQNYTQADTRLAREVLGFEANWSIEEGIRDYLSNGERSRDVV